MTERFEPREPTGGFTSVDGEQYYRISAYHRMPPFLMTLASDTDLWMFVASSGGLTAGRVDADGSLFSYETVDRLYDGHHHTGPITMVRVLEAEDPGIPWEPFSERSGEDFRIERNLYKNTIGNRLLFEEINHDLQLAFRYQWSGCEEFGWVRTATLTNLGARTVRLSLLDGLRNILPHGAPLALHQQSSSLVDAYKRCDYDPETRMGIFSLTSVIIDRPEAAEELRANTVWCHGLGDLDVTLSIDAVSAFRRGETISAERTLTGRRGSYLALSSPELPPGKPLEWHIAADAGRSHVQIAALGARLRLGGDLGGEIKASLSGASENLLRNVGSADGLQLTGDTEASAHNFANVLFNNMRGGVPASNYDILTADFREFLEVRNREIAVRHQVLLRSLPAEMSLWELLDTAVRTDDVDFQRLGYEYLPIYFGRRHGDPSRPWNRFAIRVRNADGSRALRYEGNWRDIFQNWEALSLSFPEFLPSFISKFVNASTVDGFNPYRLTRDGIDWEVADPDDPWSFIGYWGDHQIIYLLKFLEALSRYSPGELQTLLSREIFCYADVPYRLNSYEAILSDPHSTIAYDTALASKIETRVTAIGTDGKLLPGSDGSIYHVSLLEKLLVPALSKLSNLVPGGGIWMNTQRPEWNDANNALVGNGISVVTLGYLRRYLQFLESSLENTGVEAATISSEVVTWLRKLRSVLEENQPLLDAGTLSAKTRKQLMDALGGGFSEYRETVYTKGFSGKTELQLSEVTVLCRSALEYIDHAIKANRRDDGLYHSYNLIEIGTEGGGIAVRHLYEMLEGQVAALSSGVLEPREAVDLLANLFDSKLYRADQRSFLLYPERELPAFMERNCISDERVRSVPLLSDLLEAGEDSVLARDASGVCRFHGDFKNARDLASALDRLGAEELWAKPVARDRQAILETFEEVFDHQSFTGRSGTMYGYEGLGCIYWHQVSKLLLAVQEITLAAIRDGQPAAVVESLMRAYYRVRSGLSFEKTVIEYGAFPTDPYSHTPAHAGAQQPGMTGQVKEEILTRFGELGVQVEEGIVSFRPVLLRQTEFLKEPESYRFLDLRGNRRSIDLSAGSLAFSYCQVPMIYKLVVEEPWIRVVGAGGESRKNQGNRLTPGESQDLFKRRGSSALIEIGVPESSLCRI